MDKSQAIKANKNGAYAALFVGTVTFVFLLVSLFANSESGILALFNNPAIIFDVIICFVLAYAIFKGSRIASVSFVIYMILSKIYVFLETESFKGLLLFLKRWPPVEVVIYKS